MGLNVPASALIGGVPARMKRYPVIGDDIMVRLQSRRSVPLLEARGIGNAWPALRTDGFQHPADPMIAGTAAKPLAGFCTRARSVT